MLPIWPYSLFIVVTLAPSIAIARPEVSMEGLHAPQLSCTKAVINKPIQDGGEAKAPLWLNQLSGTD